MLLEKLSSRNRPKGRGRIDGEAYWNSVERYRPKKEYLCRPFRIVKTISPDRADELIKKAKGNHIPGLFSPDDIEQLPDNGGTTFTFEG